MVYRPLTSRVVVAAYAGFALWWVVDDLLTGDAGKLAVAAPVMVAVGVALWGVFWRPAVVVDDDAVELLNILRDVRVPWPALEAVDTQYALTLHVGERRYRSWAAAAPGRPLAHQPRGREDAEAAEAAPRVRSSRSLHGDSGAAAFVIEQRWERRRDAGGEAEVTTRWVWHWPAVAVAAALVAWAVALAR
jgi:hypothetical protein